ncbi:MAG TPA: tetratricopeptide repeat protein, partial [Pyrinomonadaceae bacterium]|nr:tetratricopeptide repeat protein [Pyrinomonadaceae bacterium]
MADATPQYRRPMPATATLDDYLEWEERSRELAQELSDINYATLKMPDSALSDALTIAQVTKLMSSLVTNTSVPAQSDFLLGRLYFNAGKYFDASDLLAGAADGYRSFGDPIIEVYALVMRADALLNINDREGAMRAAEYALERATDNGLEGLTASALRVKGAALTDLGRGAEALECLRLALAKRAALSEKEVSEQSVAPPPVFLHRLGKAARRFGQYEEAVSCFLELAEWERRAGRLGLRALAVSEVGYTYLHMGEEARGFNYLEQAAGIAEAAGETANALRWRTQAERWRRGQPADEHVTGLAGQEIQSEKDAYRLSLLAEGFAQQGKHEEAMTAARAVLSWSQSKGDRELELTSRSIIGKVLSEQDRLEEAVEEARRAILVADSIENDSSMLRMRGNLANCLIRLGRNNEAATVLMDGVARSQALIAQTEGAEFRQGIMAGASNLYEQLAHLCSHFEQHDHLLFVTEQARARNVAGWMEAERRLEDAAERATPGAAERLRELREVEVELEVRHFEGKVDARSVKDLQARRRHCRGALAAMVSDLGLPLLPWERVGMGFDTLDELIEGTVSDDSAVLTLFSASKGVCPVIVYRRDGQILKAGKFINWDREDRVNSLAGWSRHLAAASGVRAFS